LREAGYRVARTDLRGHGDSDSTFTSYGDEDTAADVVALTDGLGGPCGHRRQFDGRQYPRPRAEADWIAAATHGQAVMAAEAGHYPQSQRPDITISAVLQFLRRERPVT